MKFQAAFYSIFSVSFAVCGQDFYLKPEKPTAEDLIQIQYAPSSVFEHNAKISCIAYFSGLNTPGATRRDFPKAREVNLKKDGGLWLGLIDSIPPDATALIFLFKDSLGNRDTNQGKGYWTPLYRDEQPVPGAWAGIGDLLYGEWITEKAGFHISHNRDSLRQFLSKDIIQYPDVKRSYMRQYLGAFKINSESTEELFRKELRAFEDWNGLNQWEWLLLRNHYMRLGDTTDANRCQHEIIERFPQGAWAVQTKSLKLLVEIGVSRDFERQKKLYKKFADEYLKAYSDEFAALTMNNRAAQMLGYMAEHFVREDNLNVWLDEVDKLSLDARCMAYLSASRELIKLSERSTQTKNGKIPEEYMLFRSNLDEHDLMVQSAETLAARAVSLYRENIDTPVRKYNEPFYFTDEEIKGLRNEVLSGHLATWGKWLLKQNRYDEALDALREAVEKNHYTDATINEAYVQALLAVGRRDLALAETQKILARGMSTSLIDSLYKEFDTKDLAALKYKSAESQRRVVKSKVINEKLDDLIFYDEENRRLSISDHKEKIIVLSFWASWCPPCKESLRVLDNIIGRYKNEKDIIFLLMNEDADRERAKKWINSYKNKSNFVFDDNRNAVKKAGINGVPALVIIDKQGNIRFRSSGMSSYNVQENITGLEAMIEYLRER